MTDLSAYAYKAVAEACGSAGGSTIFDKNAIRNAIGVSYEAFGLAAPRSVIFVESLLQGQTLALVLRSTDSTDRRVVSSGHPLYAGAIISRLFECIKWYDDAIDPISGRELHSYLETLPSLYLYDVVESAIETAAKNRSSGMSDPVNWCHEKSFELNINDLGSECENIDNAFEYDAFLGVLGSLDLHQSALLRLVSDRKVVTPKNTIPVCNLFKQ